MENEEVIREDMERKREAINEKLEALEERVLGRVHEATTVVAETVTSVKETFHEGVESVKNAFDMPAHVDRHPWLMLGGAVLCGYVAGGLLGGERAPSNARTARQPARPPAPTPPQGRGPRPTAEETKSPFLEMIEPELTQLKGLAVGAALGTVREMVAANVPPNLGGQLRDIIDNITRKVGGEPIPSEDLEFVRAGVGADGGAHGESSEEW